MAFDRGCGTEDVSMYRLGELGMSRDREYAVCHAMNPVWQIMCAGFCSTGAVSMPAFLSLETDSRDFQIRGGSTTPGYVGWIQLYSYTQPERQGRGNYALPGRKELSFVISKPRNDGALRRLSLARKELHDYEFALLEERSETNPARSVRWVFSNVSVEEILFGWRSGVEPCEVITLGADDWQATGMGPQTPVAGAPTWSVR